jgi:hypothetical protein
MVRGASPEMIDGPLQFGGNILAAIPVPCLDYLDGFAGLPHILRGPFLAVLQAGKVRSELLQFGLDFAHVKPSTTSDFRLLPVRPPVPFVPQELHPRTRPDF